jgi:hypothetical protein
MSAEYLSYVMSQNLAHKEAKRQKKIEKRFALNLLNQAQDSSWEEHELARLFMLMTEAIELSQKKKIKFLKKSKLCGTEFLACLGDHGLVLSPKDFMAIIESKAKNPTELARVLDQNLDHSVVSVSDMDFINFVSLSLSSSHLISHPPSSADPHPRPSRGVHPKAIPAHYSHSLLPFQFPHSLRENP